MIQFHNDAAEGPDIDGTSVRDAKYYLRRTIKSALNVRVDLLLLVTAWTEVNNF